MSSRLTRFASRLLNLAVLVGLALAGSTACKSDGPLRTDAGADAEPNACAGPCQLAIVAGSPGGKGHRDGPAGEARFWNPQGLAGDAAYLYIAERSNGVIRRLDRASNQVTTIVGQLRSFAGTDQPPEDVDGPGQSARLYYPRLLALSGDSLYVGDGQYVRRVDLASSEYHVTTLRLRSTGKPWALAALCSGLAADGDRLYVGQWKEVWLYRLDQEEATRLAGDNEAAPNIVDGKGQTARFSEVAALALDPQGTLFVADQCAIRKLEPATAQVTTIAGRLHTFSDGPTCYPGHVDGSGGDAQFYPLQALAWAGDVLLATEEPYLFGPIVGLLPQHGVVRQIDPTSGQVSTAGGVLVEDTVLAGEADGPAAAARLYRPRGLWSDGANTYLATGASIRVLAGGNISSVAGKPLKDPLVGLGPPVVLGDQVYSVVDSRYELGRFRLGSGAYEQVAPFEQEFPIDWVTGMVQLGETLYLSLFSGEHKIVSYNLSSGTSAAVLTRPELTGGGGLTTDEKYLYHLVSDVTSGQAELWQIDPVSPAEVTKTALPGVPYLNPIAYHQGAIYLPQRQRLMRLSLADGSLEAVAGDPAQPGCHDGTGAGAAFTFAAGIASAGDRLYVADRACHTVSAVDPQSGTVRAMLGSPDTAVVKSGAGRAAGLASPSYLSFDPKSGALYIVDDAEDVVLRATAP